MRRAKINIPTITLTFWMVVLATTFMALVAAIFEYDAWRMPNAREWAAIAYNSLLVFGFAQAVWIGLARKLPPLASSLSVMMIPVLGVFSGMWLLNETPHWQDFLAMLLILAAMSTVLLKPRASAIK